MPHQILRILKICAPFVLTISLWKLANRYAGINPSLLPDPVAVAKALWEFARDGLLIQDTMWSISRATVGFAIGGLLGVCWGTITGRVGILNWLLSPLLNGLRSLPPVAIVPLVIVWAGFGEASKLFITSWAAFFPVWLNTHDGVASVDKSIIWAARSLGAHKINLLFKVMIPSALPRILAGLRLAISTTLICVFVAEMTGASIGLGFRLQISYLVFRVDRMLACMVVLAVTGICADRVFVWLTKNFFPWITLRHDQP